MHIDYVFLEMKSKFDFFTVSEDKKIIIFEYKGEKV